MNERPEPLIEALGKNALGQLRPDALDHLEFGLIGEVQVDVARQRCASPGSYRQTQDHQRQQLSGRTKKTRLRHASQHAMSRLRIHSSG